MHYVYGVKRYSNRNERKQRFSIDQLDQDGHYIAQAAFWFRTKDQAIKRLHELIAEDGRDGCTGEYRDSYG